jgi:hypothetical protein
MDEKDRKDEKPMKRVLTEEEKQKRLEKDRER